MSSSSSIAPNEQPYKGIGSSIAPYVIPPCAASAAIVPVFYGFIAKSAQQTGNKIPDMSIKEALKEGFKTAPTVGLIVGTQMVVQNLVEKFLMKLSNGTKDQSSGFLPMLVSSMIVGMLSAPPLAVFNGQSMGMKPLQSLKRLSAKQTGAIVARETSFLFSLRVSGPVSELMKRRCGENKAVEYSSAFVSGAIGSLIGHPADTALTCWQKNMKVDTFRQAMRGGPIKAMTVGGFSVCYKIAKELLESISN